MNQWQPVFECTDENGQAVLVAQGEIDLSVAPRFAKALDSVIGGPGTTAVVDLAQVGFIDSAGVRELLKAQRTAQARGAELILRAPSEMCRRVLELSGLWIEFTVVDAG